MMAKNTVLRLKWLEHLGVRCGDAVEVLTFCFYELAIIDHREHGLSTDLLMKNYSLPQKQRTTAVAQDF